MFYIQCTVRSLHTFQNRLPGRFTAIAITLHVWDKPGWQNVCSTLMGFVGEESSGTGSSEQFSLALSISFYRIFIFICPLRSSCNCGSSWYRPADLPQRKSSLDLLHYQFNSEPLFDSGDAGWIVCSDPYSFKLLRTYTFIIFLCFVDRASRYICVMNANLMHYLSSVYFVIQPLHVSGIFVVPHQEVYCIYTTIGRCCAFQLNVCGQLGQQTVFVRSYIKILQFQLTYWDMQYCVIYLHVVGDLLVHKPIHPT